MPCSKNKMKYGILTFHNVPNYGAALQAYALYNYLVKCGCDCEIIDYKCEKVFEKELKFDSSKKGFDKIFYKLFIWNKKKNRIDGFNKFMHTYCKVSAEHYSRANINEADKVYDAYITGSDQIWNLRITNNDYSYLLDFTNKRKIAISSSVGGFWDDDKYDKVKNCLSDFETLSTREYDTSKKINDVFKLNCHWNEDPTFLLEKKDLDNLAKKPGFSNYVLVYYPSAQLISYAKEYANKNKMKVIVIDDGVPKKGYKKINPKNPQEWLGLIKNAEAIFTNSYHGLLFSLYYNKKVWTTNTSNRQQSIYDALGISEFCLLNGETIAFKEINYDCVNRKLDTIRDNERRFVSNAVR